MDNTPDKYITRLVELSRKKLKLLEDMLSLTRAQTPEITEDGVDNLNGIIDEKQTKINAIDKIDEEFNVYFYRFKQVMKIGSLDELKGDDIKGLKELQEVVREIFKTTNETTEIEKKNSSMGKELLEKLGQEIKNINQSKKANIAYVAKYNEPPSYFIDKKK